MTDTGWVQRALERWSSQRNPEALGELLKAYRDRAYSLALRLTGSAENAEDAVQEAFLKLMSREKGFASPEEFDVTVNRAVYQCSTDALRSSRRRARREAKAGSEAVAAASTAKTEVEMSAVEEGELRERLREAVVGLPEETRAPAVLCYYQGLSESRAAEVLEIPRSTLRRRLGRAVTDLRGRLRRDGTKLGAGILVGLMAGEAALRAPATLCAALDSALPGPACARVPALSLPAAAPALPAGLLTGGATKVALGALAGAACAAIAVLSIFSAGSRNQETTSRTDRADVRPGGGESTVAVPEDREEEEPMDRKLTGLTAVAGGLILSGLAGAAEPNPEVGAIIAKIQARQAAKVQAAAKDAAERAEKYKKYREGQGGRYGQ
ncbi:MAG: RNA polymerase sigma factor [Planctomycetota bacterium]|jgi:RNA polymerase sigma-70 factor (ECF subfamily)